MRRSSVVFFAFATLSLVACKKDKDKDGYKGTDDCDDGDAGIHPGTDEICDGIDNNCDGQVDEGLLLDWYADADGDTYGDPEVVVSACNQPDGYEDNADDCNDGSDLFHPGALEDDCADPSDYNCDGSVGYADADGDGYAACNDCDDTDSAVYSPTTWYIDYDADTYGSALYTSIACTEPIGYTDDFDDCDDLNPEINPETRWYPDADADAYGDINGETQQCAAPQGPDELPDGAPDGIADYDYILDNTDCDDTNAEVNPDTLWFEDADGDGYGYPGTYVGTCEQPEGYAINADDCDDEDADINPGALEVCDGSDNDCDVEIDEDDAVDAGTFYIDVDEDGYGDAGDTTTACDAPAGYAETGDDCDDGVAEVNPGAEEICNNGQDDDCDGSGDQCSLDLLLADGVYTGSASSEYVGTSLAAAGDLNSDGYDDFIVGAKGETAGGTNAGAAFVVFGGSDVGGEAVLSASLGARFTGEAGDRAGRAVAGGADLNDDGILDLVVASPPWDKSSTQLDRGRTHVVFGPISSGMDMSLVDADYEFTGRANYNYAGVGVTLGDFNGDDIDDLVVGASGNELPASGSPSNSGTLYVVYGPISAEDVDASEVNDYITGEGSGDEVGGSIKNLGDLNGDGFDDLLVGCLKNDTGVDGVSTEGGSVYIVLGPMTGDLSLSEADVAYRGESAGDKLGGNISAAGDLNDDGVADFVAGATLDDTAGPDSGALYVVHGDPATSGGAIDELSAAKLHGAETGDGFGSAVAADGDVDGDGTNDIVVAAPNTGANIGSVYVFYGSVEGTLSASESDARFDGDTTEDQVGNALSFVGDVDGSGANDAFLIAAQSDDSSGVDDGAVYLMLGIGL